LGPHHRWACIVATNPALRAANALRDVCDCRHVCSGKFGAGILRRQRNAAAEERKTELDSLRNAPAEESKTKLDFASLIPAFAARHSQRLGSAILERKIPFF
jgi:hypothetical protein